VQQLEQRAAMDAEPVRLRVQVGIGEVDDGVAPAIVRRFALAWLERVRLALGATPRRLLLTVMRDGLLLAGAGLVVGLAAALAAARAMRQLLVGISPFDPLTFGLMAAALLAVAAAASFVPARRAMKVDPMVTLSR
jgi:hypothetical protein